jgi:Kef-type K+ transport system membrane component KefB
LTLIVGGANLAGHVFVRLRQPRIVGEILAGIILGPAVLGRLVPKLEALFGDTGSTTDVVLSFLYNLGLLFLMFVSGSAARRVLASENRAPTAWLLAVGTTLPFLLGLGLAKVLPLDALAGSNGVDSAVTLVFAIAVSVTSIPVISHIFNTLGIINTRFASASPCWRTSRCGRPSLSPPPLPQPRQPARSGARSPRTSGPRWRTWRPGTR